MDVKTQLVKVHNNDNVAVATCPIVSGTHIAEYDITVNQDIPAGHKIALTTISEGDNIVKYGFSIGAATSQINAGEHVHSHNAKTKLQGTEQYVYAPSNSASKQTHSTSGLQFMGYRRENGKVGIRNEVWIINTVGCVNRTADRIADECNRRFASECEGFRAFTHPFGCSQLGDDLDDTRTILASLASHPNAGAVLVVGLGCENNQLKNLLPHVDKPENRIRFYNAQEVVDELEEGVNAVYDLLKAMANDKREPIDASELTLGMKCGGSDAFSGITANPTVGRVTDLMCNLGGSVILTETPEMFGAEQLLMNRAKNKDVFEAFNSLIDEFKNYFICLLYTSPSPRDRTRSRMPSSA